MSKFDGTVRRSVLIEAHDFSRGSSHLGKKYPYEHFLDSRKKEFDEILQNAEMKFEIDSMIHDVDCLPPSLEKE